MSRSPQRNRPRISVGYINAGLAQSPLQEGKIILSDVGQMVADLINAGCSPGIAAEVVARAFAAGVSESCFRGNPVDSTAEKRRAYDRDRKRKSAEILRNSTGVPDATLSKEESKKKENKKEREVTRASQLPEGWLPDEQVWKAAVDRIGLDRCNAEFTKFKNHAADKGRVSKNWNAAWRNWVDRAIDYGARNGTGTNVARADTAAGRATTREANQVAIVGAAALRFLREGNPAGPVGETSGDASSAEGFDFEPKAKAAC